MKIKPITEEMSICKIQDIKDVDFSCKYCFLGKTDEEISLVCESTSVPGNTVERSDGWRGFRIEGVLDFSLTGILSGVASILAEEKIPIFAVSTYNTDYVLVKREYFNRALEALGAYGYDIGA